MSLEKNLSNVVISCGFEVSNRLGTGFLESVYENALCVELEKQGYTFHQQKQLKVIYRGEIVGSFVVDIAFEINGYLLN